MLWKQLKTPILSTTQDFPETFVAVAEIAVGYRLSKICRGQ